MTRDAEAPEGVWWPVWMRLPIAAAAVAAIVWLARRMPPLPVAPWAVIQPVRDEEISSWLAFGAWAALVALLAWIAVSTLRRGGRSAPALEPSELVVRRPLTPVALPVRVAPSTALLKVFASPRQTAPSETPVRHNPDPVEPVEAVEAAQRPVEAVATAGMVRPMLRLFGPLAIDWPPRARLQNRWGRALVAYLAVKGAAASIDELSDALWPDEHQPARRRIWSAKHQAQAVLGDVLQCEGDSYRLDLSRVCLDIDEIERLRQGDPSAEQLDRALSLMDGEPLAGIPYAWADSERRRLDAIRMDTLARVAESRLSRNEPANALKAVEELLRIDPLNEQAWQLAMRADAALGHRQAILDRYQQLTREIDERLGLKPSATTRDLYHQLLSQT